MKISIKFQACLVCLFCFAWQNSNSQLLYPELYPVPKKDEYIPPYDPNVVIISPNVEKWMNEQIARENEKRTVEMKTDALGRPKKTGKTVQGTKEVEVVQATEPKQKRLVRISEMHYPQIEMEPMHGSFEYNPETKEDSYYLNGKKVSVEEYEVLTKKYYEKIDKQKTGKRKLSIPGVISSDELGWTALMTAEEISTLIKNYKELSIDDYRKVVGGATDVSSILETIRLSTWGHSYRFYGDGIGVYVMEAGCRATYPNLVNSNNYTGYCTGTTSIHHNQVVNVLQRAAPKAHIFGFNASTTHPSNPRSKIPPIEIGNHSYMECLSSGTTDEAKAYKYIDSEMDRYIYDNRIINLVCTGNKKYNPNCDPCKPLLCDTTSHVASPGKAVNAITVGAVHSSGGLYPNRYAWYTQWKPSIVGNRKPEIAMYTDIGLGSDYGGDFDGCSAATPLAAGFVASMLEERPSFKEQPALVKAVLMNAARIPILNADSIGAVAKGITDYLDAARSWKWKWWNGVNSCFFDSNNEITFMEDGIQANKNYKIAIAWLTDPNYTNNTKKISQDLDLRIYQDGKYLTGSASVNDPFELVSFTALSNAPLKVVIRRYRNGDTNGATNGGNVLLGYSLRYVY